MDLSLRHAWMRAAVKETRRRARMTIAQTDGYELSSAGMKARAMALELVQRLEGL